MTSGLVDEDEDVLTDPENELRVTFHFIFSLTCNQSGPEYFKIGDVRMTSQCIVAELAAIACVQEENTILLLLCHSMFQEDKKEELSHWSL